MPTFPTPKKFKKLFSLPPGYSPFPPGRAGVGNSKPGTENSKARQRIQKPEQEFASSHLSKVRRITPNTPLPRCVKLTTTPRKIQQNPAKIQQNPKSTPSAVQEETN